MKTKLLKLSQIGAMLMVANSALAYRVPVFVELNNSSTIDGDTRTQVTEAYVNGTIKINETYSLVPELRTDFFYKEGGAKNDFKAKHAYSRVWLYQYGVDNFGPWKLDIGYRYRLPTESSYQIEGNFGQIGVRPALTGKFGNFSLVARDFVTVFLQRSGLEKNQTVQSPAARQGTRIMANQFELISGYDIVPGLTASAAFSMTNGIRSSVGPDSYHWENEFEQEFEIGYRDEKYTANTYVGVSYYSTINPSPNKTVDWYDGDVSKLSLKIAREF